MSPEDEELCTRSPRLPPSVCGYRTLWERGHCNFHTLDKLGQKPRRACVDVRGRMKAGYAPVIFCKASTEHNQRCAAKHRTWNSLSRSTRHISSWTSSKSQVRDRTRWVQLRRTLIPCQLSQVLVSPCMRRDLVTVVVRILDTLGLTSVVYATVWKS